MPNVLPQVRVASWNVRTLAMQAPTTPVVERIAEIVRKTDADIICFQELMPGTNAPNWIGAPVSTESRTAIEQIRTALHDEDEGAGWDHAISGVNMTTGKHMRDAYAFFWKRTPENSEYLKTAPPVDRIELVSPPVISTWDKFPGRRTGSVVMKVLSKGAWAELTVVSWHAQTPTNKFRPKPDPKRGAGTAINKLGYVSTIGGGSLVRQTYEESVGPLPVVDTVVVGDFNFVMSQNDSKKIYRNLQKNYTACVSNTDAWRNTTYSPNGNRPWRLVSSYDNIFVLDAHGPFKRTFEPNEAGVVNFILDEVEELGEFLSMHYTDEELWFEVHAEDYKKQRGRTGVSDHLPVWCDFDVSSPLNAGKQQHTANADGNSLLHAAFGVWNPQHQGYIDYGVTKRRQDLVDAIAKLLGAKTPDPALLTLLYAAVHAQFSNVPTVATQLQQAAKLQAPWTQTGALLSCWNRYLSGLRQTRDLTIFEAGLMAWVGGFTLQVHRAYAKTKLPSETFNPGKQDQRHVYLTGAQFMRWAT